MANSNGPNQERIHAAALELLQERGLAGLSMRALADRVHVKAPSLYKHISGRDEIIARLQSSGIRDFIDAIEQAGATKRAKALAYRRWALENPHLYEVTFKIPLLRDLLPVGLESGATAMIIRITGGDHEHARAVWGLLHGLVDLEIAGRFPPDADLEKTWKRAVAMIG